MKWLKEIRGWLAWRPILAESGLEIRQGLLRSLMDLRTENNQLRTENARLESIIEEPGSLVEMATENGGIAAEWNHWGVKHLVHSLEETLGSAPNGVAMEVGLRGTDRHYEVVISRKSGVSIYQRLGELEVTMKGLLDNLTRHYVGTYNQHDTLLTIPHFDVIFGVDERIAIKRAIQYLENCQCFNERHGSGSGSAAEKSASTS